MIGHCGVCFSRLQNCASIPVGGIPRIPDGADSHNTADFCYPEAVAKLGENILVVGVDEPSNPDLKWDIGIQ